MEPKAAGISTAILCDVLVYISSIIRITNLFKRIETLQKFNRKQPDDKNDSSSLTIYTPCQHIAAPQFINDTINVVFMRPACVLQCLLCVRLFYGSLRMCMLIAVGTMTSSHCNLIPATFKT